MSYDGKLRAHFEAFTGSSVPIRPYQRPKLPVGKTYCILMTPRSGSTWLCRRIARLDVLSCPEEHFNAEEFSNTLRFNPGRDIYEVFDIVAGKNCTNTGIFGFKMSYFDLEEFEREAKLLEVMLGKKYFFYLSRHNFVAQAISLYIAVESQRFHTYTKLSAHPEEAAEIPYDEEKIMYWACHILQQEYGIQQWLNANAIRPVLLSYEDLLDDIDGAIGRIADHLGVDLSGARAVAIPQTEKIAPDYAAGYERVFRAGYGEFCRTWKALRGTVPCPYTGAGSMLVR
ncbi:MAG TPA: Stf0 family sulfotransferase [Stellaceae bacterium]|jgi:LPS sulfotransferase NodH|nr:Stf0 family sulfotransferase [Stellaceae bacterium]